MRLMIVPVPSSYWVVRYAKMSPHNISMQGAIMANVAMVKVQLISDSDLLFLVGIM